jgi:cold shock CspA family protein/ribosome-associated translation inhibitor RaiA
MQTPVEIDFQGMTATPRVQAAIDAQVARLEGRYGRVTACRVALKAPSGRHQTGGLYEVSIRLALPDGREVNVARTPHADERHADVSFAINDAFKRARRRLQDHVRRLQNRVKQHDGPPVGTVVRIDPSGEFGFIASADGNELYFHRNSVLDPPKRLEVGARVSFAEAMGDKGPQASTVKLLGKHKLRPVG